MPVMMRGPIAHQLCVGRDRETKKDLEDIHTWFNTSKMLLVLLVN